LSISARKSFFCGRRRRRGILARDQQIVGDDMGLPVRALAISAAVLGQPVFDEMFIGCSGKKRRHDRANANPDRNACQRHGALAYRDMPTRFASRTAAIEHHVVGHPSRAAKQSRRRPTHARDAHRRRRGHATSRVNAWLVRD
jgi:hypothetical protein